MEAAVKQVQHASISSLTVTFEVAQREIKNDSTLQAVVNYLHLGWPDKKYITDEIQPYYSRCINLLMVNDSLMLEERIVIPDKDNYSITNYQIY